VSHVGDVNMATTESLITLTSVPQLFALQVCD
jgi:hypothetical protein